MTRTTLRAAPTVPRADAVRELAYAGAATRAIRALAVEGIPVMPLKGILFAYWLYEEPAERLHGDIDLLVPEAAFAAATATLGRLGYTGRHLSANGREIVLVSQASPIEIDLHRALFALGRFRLDTATLFLRGRRDTTLFGCEVILPDPYDAFAHLVGHDAALHAPELLPQRREDYGRLARCGTLDATRCARHLHDAGFARAARYTLGQLAGDPFCDAVRRALPPDPLGERLADLAWRLSSRHDQVSIASQFAGLITNSSLPLAAWSLVASVLNRIRFRLGMTPW